MRRIAPRLAAAALAAVFHSGVDALDAPGALVIVGGGGTTPEIVSRTIELAGGRHAVVAVIDHPTLVGLGIDEATAVVVRAGRIEVVGQSAAIVFDARRASVATTVAGGVVAATGLTVHVLRPGMTWDLAGPK